LRPIKRAANTTVVVHRIRFSAELACKRASYLSALALGDDDAIRLARVAGAADVYVDLQIWPEMIHVWHLFHPELSAGKKAIQAGGAFVRDHLAA